MYYYNYLMTAPVIYDDIYLIASEVFNIFNEYTGFQFSIVYPQSIHKVNEQKSELKKGHVFIYK